MKRIKCTNLIKGVSNRLGFCHGNNLHIICLTIGTVDIMRTVHLPLPLFP